MQATSDIDTNLYDQAHRELGFLFVGAFGEDHEIKVSLIFYVLWELADTVLNLPTALYSTFGVEFTGYLL